MSIDTRAARSITCVHGSNWQARKPLRECAVTARSDVEKMHNSSTLLPTLFRTTCNGLFGIEVDGSAGSIDRQEEFLKTRQSIRGGDPARMGQSPSSSPMWCCA